MLLGRADEGVVWGAAEAEAGGRVGGVSDQEGAGGEGEEESKTEWDETKDIEAEKRLKRKSQRSIGKYIFVTGNELGLGECFKT